MPALDKEVRDLEEVRGLEEMRSLKNEFLQNNDEEPLVKQFLQEVDDQTMLQFLRGRKFNSKYAWETLKRNAEVKLVKYPDFFPKELPQNIASLRDCPPLCVLKHRDKHGRRILIFDSALWDADKHSLIDISMFAVYIMEKIVRDRDAMENGIVSIQQCSQLGIKHCLHYSLKALRQLIMIFWHAYPVRYKGVYYVNTPYMLSCTLSLARVFFPKKLKERLHVGTADGGFKALHQNIPPDILPKCVGGKLEYEDAIDYEMAVR